MATRTRGASQLRHVELRLRPTDRFPVPKSNGYPVYGALLGVLAAVDEDVSAHVHDSPLGNLHSSGLQGVFAGSDRPHHKTLLSDETYELTLGIVDPDDTEVFQALVSALVLEGETLELSEGTVRVESFESTNVTHAELLERASETDDPSIEITFRTATCIEEAEEVTTMFPYRWAVFKSLLGKWNRSCPEELELDLDRETVLGNVIEKPDVRSYDTHSVLVNRVENEDGKNRNLFKQGFTGECVYDFKGASESVENAVTALGLFGEYSGVGSAVSRGCGSMDVIIK